MFRPIGNGNGYGYGDGDGDGDDGYGDGYGYGYSYGDCNGFGNETVGSLKMLNSGETE